MTRDLRSLEKENARPKKLVAEQAMDMEILKEANLDFRIVVGESIGVTASGHTLSCSV